MCSHFNKEKRQNYPLERIYSVLYTEEIFFLIKNCVANKKNMFE